MGRLMRDASVPLTCVASPDMILGILSYKRLEYPRLLDLLSEGLTINMTSTHAPIHLFDSCYSLLSGDAFQQRTLKLCLLILFATRRSSGRTPVLKNSKIAWYDGWGTLPLPSKVFSITSFI
ncbi:hypothetical protein LIER_17409 [Lithospermum erythrorhizon]|uniref:Uncharacterized protein n=1 Tax=Lithospermum erythrorhizon TaxID=34254 RepID=A0AAV3QEJ6_LITER